MTSPAKTYTNTYLSGGGYASAYIYNRLLSTTLAAGSSNLTLTTNTYDGAAPADAPGVTQHDSGCDTSFLYRGNLTTSASFATTQQMAYDITGSVVSSSDSNPNHAVSVTTGTGTNYAAPTAITTANSLTTSMSWNSMLNPSGATGPNGDSASSTYDSASRPSSATSPYGAVTTYTYSTLSPQITAAVDGRWTQTYLDGLGRTTRIAQGYGSGSSSTTVSYTDTVYDTCGCTPVGKPYKTSLPYAPGATPGWKANTYDALGRTLTTVAPDGASTATYSYAGNIFTVSDPAGKWKTYTSDAFGELTQVLEPSPSPSTEPNHVTSYTYDALGHLVQAQMPRTVSGTVVTQVRTWTYDPSSQWLTQTTQPETGTVSFTYNADGTTATKTDAKGQQTQYSYDIYGELVQVSRGTLSGGVFTENVAQRVTYTYGASGASNGTAGRVQTASYAGPDGLGITESYQYSAAGDVSVKNLAVGSSASISASYSYDSEGRVTSVQYPHTGSSAAVYSYAYDNMGRLTTMLDQNNNQLVSGVTYNAANQWLSISGTVLNETRTYNANAQVISLVSGSYQYKYNYSATQNNGRVQSMQDVASGETAVYQYDSLNRLVSAAGTGDPQGNWSQTFSYDGFGNLVQKAGSNAPNVTSWRVNPATNQLTSNGAQYDGNGNLTAYSGAGTYSYDMTDRLLTANSTSGATAAYLYDPSNQRVYSKVTSGGTTTEQIYFYGADGKKLQVWHLSVSNGNASLTLVSNNQWFGGRLLKPEDRLQSIGKYFPYGEDRYSPNPANPAGDIEKFATYTQDSATGLSYAYQRYYASGIGRFMTADPYSASGGPRSPQSWNRYSYAENDPVNGVDPEGTCSASVSAAGVTTTEWSDCFMLAGLLLSGGGSSANSLEMLKEPVRGTGAVSFSAAQAAFRSAAVTLSKTKFNAKCQDDFKTLGTNAASVAAGAAKADFQNGVNSSVPLSTLYTSSAMPAVARAGSALTGTIGSFIRENPATEALAQLGGSTIYLNASHINPSDYYDNLSTVLHEVLHNVTSLTDQDIQRLFGLPQAKVTNNITLKLLKDCF